MARDDDWLPAGGNPSPDDEREVRLGDAVDDLVVLPDSTVDDTDAGWGERPWSNDRRLLDERPPHWD